MDTILISTLATLAGKWQAEADAHVTSPSTYGTARRETLRECADSLRMLCEVRFEDCPHAAPLLRRVPGEAVPDWPGQAMSQRRNVTPWFPVAVDPVHEGIYEVEYRQSRFLFRREWRDGVWAIPGAVLLPATQPKRWRGLTAPARTMPKDQR